MVQCQICQKEFLIHNYLALHITVKEKWTVLDYYTTYIEPQKYCPECGKPCRLLSLRDGFNKTCGSKCGGIMARRLLRNKPVKYHQYLDRYTASITKAWNKKILDGTFMVGISKVPSFKLAEDDIRYTPFGFVDNGLDIPNDPPIDF